MTVITRFSNSVSPEPSEPIAHIEQRLVIVRLELRHLIGRIFAHAAFEILELLGRKLVAPLELRRRRIKQDIHVRAGFEELPERIFLLAHAISGRH